MVKKCKTSFCTNYGHKIAAKYAKLMPRNFFPHSIIFLPKGTMRIQFSDPNPRKVIDNPHYYALKFIIVFVPRSLLLGYSQPMAEYGRDTKAETFLED